MSTELALAWIAAGTQVFLGLCTLAGVWFAHRKLNHITVLTNSTLTTANLRIAQLEQALLPRVVK